MDCYKATIWCDSELEPGEFAIAFHTFLEGLYSEPDKIVSGFGLAIEHLGSEEDT